MMAEAIGVASGLLTLATFAFQSGIALAQAVKEFKNHPKNARDLIVEIDALCSALASLTDTVNTEIDVDLSALKLPLLQCGNACKGFRAELIRCSSRSADGRTSFRDWARLRYIGDDITAFTQSIAGYKSTIVVVLTHANLRKSCITADTLAGYRTLVEDATVDLEARLDSIDNKLDDILEHNKPHNDGSASKALQLVKAERSSTQNCLQLCAQLADHLNEAQLLCRQGDPPGEQVGLDTSSETIMNQGLQECRKNLEATTVKLEAHMTSVIDRLISKSEGIGLTKSDKMELEGVRDQWESVQQCRTLCSQLDRHLKDDVSVIENYATGDATQFMVSTNNKTIHGKNRGLGWRTKQLGGHVSDATIQQVSRDFSTIYIQSNDDDRLTPQYDVQAKSDKRGGHDRQPNFNGKYGKGRTVTNISP